VTPTSEGRALPQRTEGDRRNREESPTSETKALPQRAQRNTEEETAENLTAKVAESAEQDKGRASQFESNLETQDAEGIPGVESAKSLFFG
jgi:cell division septation protein DedD